MAISRWSLEGICWVQQTSKPNPSNHVLHIRFHNVMEENRASAADQHRMFLLQFVKFMVALFYCDGLPLDTETCNEFYWLQNTTVTSLGESSALGSVFTLCGDPAIVPITYSCTQFTSLHVSLCRQVMDHFYCTTAQKTLQLWCCWLFILCGTHWSILICCKCSQSIEDAMSSSCISHTYWCGLPSLPSVQHCQRLEAILDIPPFLG